MEITNNDYKKKRNTNHYNRSDFFHMRYQCKKNNQINIESIFDILVK